MLESGEPLRILIVADHWILPYDGVGCHYNQGESYHQLKFADFAVNFSLLDKLLLQNTMQHHQAKRN
jgi:hypothetical protein